MYVKKNQYGLRFEKKYAQMNNKRTNSMKDKVAGKKRKLSNQVINSPFKVQRGVSYIIYNIYNINYIDLYSLYSLIELIDFKNNYY